MGLIHQLGKMFFYENALKLCHDLKNKNMIGLKYCLFEEFDSGLEDILHMLSILGWVNIC